MVLCGVKNAQMLHALVLILISNFKLLNVIRNTVIIIYICCDHNLLNLWLVLSSVIRTNFANSTRLETVPTADLITDEKYC